MTNKSLARGRYKEAQICLSTKKWKVTKLILFSNLKMVLAYGEETQQHSKKKGFYEKDTNHTVINKTVYRYSSKRDHKRRAVENHECRENRNYCHNKKLKMDWTHIKKGCNVMSQALDTALL